MFVVEISIENISLTYGDVSQKMYVGKHVTFFGVTWNPDLIQIPLTIYNAHTLPNSYHLK